MHQVVKDLKGITVVTDDFIEKGDILRSEKGNFIRALLNGPNYLDAFEGICLKVDASTTDLPRVTKVASLISDEWYAAMNARPHIKLWTFNYEYELVESLTDLYNLK